MQDIFQLVRIISFALHSHFFDGDVNEYLPHMSNKQQSHRMNLSLNFS